jgi:ribose transport system permease protein
MFQKLLSSYGMVFVLLGLCILFSILTLEPQPMTSEAATAKLAKKIIDKLEHGCVIIVGAKATESAEVAQKVDQQLKAQKADNYYTVIGAPQDLRRTLDEIESNGLGLSAVVTSGKAASWIILESIVETHPKLGEHELIVAQTQLFPNFLKKGNLLAIVDRIVVIAVIAIGMTMVIITGGIELSVGSMVAFSAVIATVFMKSMGGLEAGPMVVLTGFAIAVLSCSVVGLFTGLLVSRCTIAPFIATLGVMMIARGLAFMITGGFSVYQVPASLSWLGQGRSLGVPNTVILLVVLYTIAHIFMSRTAMGRRIYAVGGNKEAARLSGVPVAHVLTLVYIICGICAGLGGCIQASQLNSGTPNMGMMYELYVIAAVVVGGTSLSGGSGKILGTLIGAFIISVIQNGMNLLGIESYTQQVVLGAIIIIAVLLDKIRNGQDIPWLKLSGSKQKKGKQ